MRMAGEGFGIGKYALDLFSALLKRKNDFKYVLFFDKNFNSGEYEKFKNLGADCRLVSAKYYSFGEQVNLPRILNQENLDLVHFPNFNVPVLYRKKFVTTIHDLIHHRFPGNKKKNFLYRLAYRFIIWRAAQSAKKVIAVSKSTKSDIIKLLGTKAEKVEVVYEGVSNIYRRGVGYNQIESVKTKLGIVKPYFLFVGVCRRYKNLEFLAEAFAKWSRKIGNKYQLVLAGAVDKNYPEVAKRVHNLLNPQILIAPGKVSDEDLSALYSGSDGFINPSLSEGFGLPYLEAQSSKTPVICSDIPVAREILGNSVLYFDPYNIESLINVLDELSNNNSLRQRLVELGMNNVSAYTWDKAAEATELVYKKALS